MNGLEWKIISALIIIVILYFIWYCWKYSIYNVSRVYSTVDGEAYYVHNAHPHKWEAANMLAEVSKNIHIVIKHLKENIKPDHPYYDRVQFLLKNYNPDVLIENSPLNIRKFTSYTENKGKIFCICLRKRYSVDNEFVDPNTLMFVILHEISHMFTPEFGHDPPFWRNFKFMLQEAVKLGVYVPTNYAERPEIYCGLRLSYNPYMDSNIDVFDDSY